MWLEVIAVEYSKLELRVPKTVVSALSMSGAEMASDFSRRIALSLFAEGILSLGKAAELAGMSYREFFDLARAKKVPLNYTAEDLEADIQTLRGVAES